MTWFFPEAIENILTYHCVQLLRSMPVRALVVRIAVRIRTWGSSRGLVPSKEGDQGPPIAMVSFLPLSPTRKWISRVGWTNPSWTSGGSSANAQDLWYKSSRLGQDINITYKIGHSYCYTCTWIAKKIAHVVKTAMFYDRYHFKNHIIFTIPYIVNI